MYTWPTYVSNMYQTCTKHVPNMYQTYNVPNMYQTCIKNISGCDPDSSLLGLNVHVTNLNIKNIIQHHYRPLTSVFNILQHYKPRFSTENLMFIRVNSCADMNIYFLNFLVAIMWYDVYLLATQWRIFTSNSMTYVY